MTARERQLAYAAWVAVCIFWGTTYLAIRVGVQSVPPLLFAGVRFLIAGALLLAFLTLRGETLPRGRDWLRLAIVGLALLGFANGFVVWSAKWLPSGVGALVVAMTPFWMLGMEAALPGGDRIKPRDVAGLLLGFGGLLFLVWPRIYGVTFDGDMARGILALQGACLFWSLGSIYARRQPSEVKPLVGAAVQMLVAGVVVSLLGLAAGEGSRLHWTPAGIGSIAYLVVFGSIVGYGCYIYSLQKLPISTVSLYSYVNPVVAVVLGWALLGEPLGWREWTAMAVILGGAGVVQSSRIRKRDDEG
ncbi:MAG: EamA family transporter [Armatimonadota bacterium]